MSSHLSSNDDEDSSVVTPSQTMSGGGELSGFDTFVLDYDTPWPASVVLNRRAVTKYQIIFRHLFHFKCAEREVCRSWQRLQIMRGAQLGRMFAETHSLTQRMLNFLQNYLYYVTNEVIEPRWDAMIVRVDNARSVDELITAHDAFLEACMKDAMLFWPKILKCLERARASCRRFAQDGERFADVIERLKENSMDAMTADRLVALEEEVEAVTSDTQSRFRQLVSDLLNALNEAGDVDANVASLVSRLDFNGYYGT
jgi:gamma-tubulin complex component 2